MGGHVSPEAEEWPFLELQRPDQRYHFCGKGQRNIDPARMRAAETEKMRGQSLKGRMVPFKEL
jgi:hypothetical protein